MLLEQRLETILNVSDLKIYRKKHNHRLVRDLKNESMHCNMLSTGTKIQI